MSSLLGAVHYAVWRNDLSGVQSMLKDGVDVSQTEDHHKSSSTTVLHTAARGTVALLDLLLDHGAKQLLEEKCGPGEEGRWAGHTALQMAAKQGCRDVAERMIAVGAKYDIFSAVALGHMDRIKLLVEQDESLLISKDDYHATLLHWAADRDQHKVADFLIQKGADINTHDDFDETPLLVASVQQCAHSQVAQLARRHRLRVSYQSIAELLLQHGAKIDVFAAAALGNNTLLDQLLNSDATVITAKNRHGTTPLHWAARNAHVESAQLLLEGGADIDAKDNIGCPPPELVNESETLRCFS